MSTYTNLNNTLKETINVDYHTRKTNQVVKFENGLNEYWGTLHGKIEGQGSKISDCQLSNVTITDAVLCGNISWDDKDFPASKIIQSLKDLSDSLYDADSGDIPHIKDRLNNIDDRLDGMPDINKVSNDITSIINQTSSQLSLDISHLSSAIDTISDSIDLSAKDLSNAIALSIENINFSISETNQYINNVEKNYKAADKAINAKLDTHIEENEIEFQNVYHSIERDRHYHVKSVPTTSYPYQLEDFSINRLEFRVSDGEMLYDGKQIGEVYLRDDDTISSFQTFDLSQFPELTQPLCSGKFYTILDDEQTPVENGYYLQNNETSFVIKRAGSKYLNVVVPVEKDGETVAKTIGRVVSFLPDASAGERVEDVQLGNINIFTTIDSILSTFNIGNTYFSKDLSTIVYPNNSNKIVYGGSNQLLFKFNCTTDNACYIKDTSNVKFGMILSNDVYGDVPDDISKFKVYVDGLSEKCVLLLSSDDFYKESADGVRIKYDKSSHVLSAEDDITYQYVFKATETGVKYSNLSARVVDKNIHLSSNNFSKLAVTIRDPHEAIDGKTYELSSVPESFGTEWACQIEEETAAGTLSLSLQYNGLILTKTINSTYASPIGPIPYKVIDDSEEIVSSRKRVSIPIDFNFNVQVDDPEVEIRGEINSLVKEDGASQIADITIHKDKSLPIKLYVPECDKSGDLSSISREFLITTYIKSSSKSSVEFKFFDPNGIDDGKSDVVIFNDKIKQLFVPTNNYYTYKLSEVKPNAFLVVDLNHHDLSVDIEQLSNAIKKETEERIANEQYLSSCISSNSNDISDLYKQISGGITYRDNIQLDIAKVRPEDDLSALFFNNQWKKVESKGIIPDPTKILETKLRNGFYYIAIAEDKAKKYVYSGLQIANKDAIIIKESCAISSIDANKVNIIDNMDADVFHLSAENGNLISCNNIFYGEQTFKDAIRVTSADLSVESVKKLYVNNPNQIGLKVTGNSYMNGLTADSISSTALSVAAEKIYISDARNTTLFELSSDLQTQISTNRENIESLSSDIYKNVDSGDLSSRGLSGKVEFLLSSDKSSMCYGRTLRSIDITGRHEYSFSNFLSDNFGRDDQLLKQGFMFRLSAAQRFIPHWTVGPEPSAYFLFENDYVIVNKDKIVRDITSDDIDIIYDASHESFDISTELSVQRSRIDTISTHLDNLEISANEISAEINRLCSEISTDISSKYYSTTLSIDSISTQVSTNVDFISRVSSDIYKNVYSGDLASRGLSGKVEFLLSSDKSSMCYGRTLKNFNPVPFKPFKLKDFLSANFGSDRGFLKSGFMFRLSATQEFYADAYATIPTYVFGLNDYFIVNKDVVVSDITSSDVDIIYDASHESFAISSDLSDLRLSVQQTSSYIDKLELSVSELSTITRGICVDLSNDVSNYVKLSGNNTISNFNEFTGTTIFNEIKTQRLSTNFNYVFDCDSNRKLSDLLDDLTDDSYVIEMVTLINDIIEYAKFTDIPKIDIEDAYEDYVHDIAERATLICRKAGFDCNVESLRTIASDLNKSLKILPASEYVLTLENRLRQLQKNIDFIERYVGRVESNLSGLSVECESNFSLLDDKVSKLCNDVNYLSDDVNYLSSELSDYHNTLSGIDRMNDVMHDVKTDNLMLTDMRDVIGHTSHDRYYLQVLSGTLVLVPIK